MAAGHEGLSFPQRKEKARYAFTMFTFFRTYEKIYLHYKDHPVLTEVWEINHSIYSGYAVKPGARIYWRFRRMVFDPGFRALVDNLEIGSLRDVDVATGLLISDMTKAWNKRMYKTSETWENLPRLFIRQQIYKRYELGKWEIIIGNGP
jgi:hypothetical protein